MLYCEQLWHMDYINSNILFKYLCWNYHISNPFIFDHMCHREEQLAVKRSEKAGRGAR